MNANRRPAPGVKLQVFLRDLCEAFAVFAVKGFEVLNRKVRKERRGVANKN